MRGRDTNKGDDKQHITIKSEGGGNSPFEFAKCPILAS